MGLADLKKNVIYLNPEIEPVDGSCKTGQWNYRPKKKIKFADGEQYFLTLLHEIGHFKIKKKPLKEWINLKRKLMREAKEYLRIDKTRAISWGDKPKTRKEEQEYIDWHLDSNAEVVRKKGESYSYYLGRCEDFRSWLLGGWISRHISVEEWARKQFKKRRKKIRELLNRC